MLSGRGKRRNKRRMTYFLTYLMMTVNIFIYMPLKFQLYFLVSF